MYSDTAHPHGKRERAKAANRQAILEAARAVFAELGYEATSIRDIIRRTDLASGTFYNYFKSKEEVFEALTIESVKRFRPLLQTVRETANTFEEYLMGAYGAYFGFIAKQNADAISEGVPHIALIGVRVDAPDIQGIFEEIRQDIVRVADEGLIEAIDVEYLTASAIGIARELGDHMLQRRPIDVDETTRFASSLLLNGVVGMDRQPK